MTRVSGGLEQVIDRVNNLDSNTVNSCGKRHVCDAMSVVRVVERSDGSLHLEKGYLRQVVDTAADVIFELSRPFLEAAGLGRVARREVSFTDLLVDIIDSAIIGVTRLVAGRRLSRQLEEISPVTSLLSTVGSVVPKEYYGKYVSECDHVVDLLVDFTGAADRTTGSYKLVRAAGLGYVWGEPGAEDNICHYTKEDQGVRCETPLDTILNINDKELGKVARPRDSSIHPLMDRTRNTQATTRVSFDFKLSDMMEPTRALCRVDGIVGAINGYDGSEGSGDGEENAEESGLIIRRVNSVQSEVDTIQWSELDMEQKNLISEWKRLKDARMQRNEMAPRDRTSDIDTFENYCDNMTIAEIEEIVKEEYKLDISQAASPTTPPPQFQSEVEIRKQAEDAVELAEQIVSLLSNMTDTVKEEVDGEAVIAEVKRKITSAGRLADRSLIVSRSLLPGRTKSATHEDLVRSLITKYNLEKKGKVEKVLELERKKGEPVLLILFDNTEYRDDVLRTSRRSGGTKLRKPNLKDLKKVLDLQRNF